RSSCGWSARCLGQSQVVVELRLDREIHRLSAWPWIWSQQRRDRRGWRAGAVAHEPRWPSSRRAALAMADWTQIASGTGVDIPDGQMDLDNNAYLLVIDSPVDIPSEAVGVVQNALAFLGVPVQVRLSASNQLQVQLG